jgi:2-dehydropantoate 2-reductase
MRILVLGAGALGGYFGAKLLQGGANVEFLVCSARAAQLAENGLVVRAPEGVTTTRVKTLSASEISGPYDVILLSCKAYDIGGAMDALAPAIDPGTATLPVLNGVKHIETLASRFGRRQVLGGLTLEHGALSPNGDIVRSPLSAAHAMTTFGELDGTLSDRCQAIQRALFRWRNECQRQRCDHGGHVGEVSGVCHREHRIDALPVKGGCYRLLRERREVR